MTIALYAVLFLPLPVIAGESKLDADDILVRYQVDMKVQRLADSVFRQLSQVTTVFSATNALLAHTGADAPQTHRTLGWMIKGIPVLRAIIVVGPDGHLLYDSVTLPTPNLDLGDRAYFSAAPAGEGVAPFIGTPIIGRSSNLPFLAVSRRLDSGAVAVAMVNPDSLIPPYFRCGTCLSAVLSGQGEVLASVPDGYRPPPEIIQRIRDDGSSSGLSDAMSGQLKAIIGWRSVERFGLTVVTSVLSQ